MLKSDTVLFEISLAKAAPTIEPVEVPASKSNICESGTLYSFSKKFKDVDWKRPLIPPLRKRKNVKSLFHYFLPLTLLELKTENHAFCSRYVIQPLMIKAVKYFSLP